MCFRKKSNSEVTYLNKETNDKPLKYGSMKRVKNNTSEHETERPKLNDRYLLNSNFKATICAYWLKLIQRQT